ncbi:hypothetical protein, partial [Rhodoferax sp.]|uniref:hypothetical protein n=1 Tax=Rhodoferax sp. TaxID=50421 RepID=UPI003BB508DF
MKEHACHSGLDVEEHTCHAGLDPASMTPLNSWIADQVRNDSLLSCFGVAGRPCKLAGDDAAAQA